jgi:8-oxo-dGTP diphosphatase
MQKSPAVLGLKRNAVLCLLNHRGDDLMLHRAREPNRGLWVPVGGKLEPFESPRAAAIRELREEAGIAVPEVRLLGTLVETSPTAYNWWTAVYHAELPHDGPRPALAWCAEGELRWVPGSQLLELPMPPTDRHIYACRDERRAFMLSAEYDEALALVRLDEELSGTRLQ